MKFYNVAAVVFLVAAAGCGSKTPASDTTSGGGATEATSGSGALPTGVTREETDEQKPLPRCVHDVPAPGPCTCVARVSGWFKTCGKDQTCTGDDLPECV